MNTHIQRAVGSARMGGEAECRGRHGGRTAGAPRSRVARAAVRPSGGADGRSAGRRCAVESAGVAPLGGEVPR